MLLELDPLVLVPALLLGAGVLYLAWCQTSSTIPGPRLATLSSAWILYHTWAEHRNRLVHKLHARYGPVVRLSPGEVSVSDPALISTIYLKNYDKSSFYGQYGAYGYLNAFSMLDRAPHQARRKIFTRVYAKSTIDSAANLEATRGKIDNLVHYVESRRFTGAIDVYNLFHGLAMDVVTNFMLGHGHGTDLLSSGDWSMIINYRLQAATWFWVTHLPRFYDWVVDKTTATATGIISDWLIDLYTASPADDSGLSVASVMAKAGLVGPAACSEVEDHVAAGHETTGVTLTYLVYHLSTHPEVQRRLQAELDQSDCLDYHVIDKLPYLNGVLQETLRLYTAIPGAEPRIVPAPGVTIGGHFVPAGTIISMQPWTLHRDPTVYKDPLRFDPDRWIGQDEATLRLMNRNFLAFGAGIRMCIGMNLAIQEMKMAVAALYLRYSTTLPHDFDHGLMYMADKYTSHPIGHICRVIFSQR